MTKVNLNANHTWFDIGDDQVIMIESIEVNEDFDKISMTLRDDRGGKKVERFDFGVKNKYRDISLNNFAAIAKAATHNYKLKEIDIDNLPGHFFLANIIEDNGKDGNIYPKITRVRQTDETFELPVFDKTKATPFIIYDEDDETEETEDTKGIEDESPVDDLSDDDLFG